MVFELKEDMIPGEKPVPLLINSMYQCVRQDVFTKLEGYLVQINISKCCDLRGIDYK